LPPERTTPEARGEYLVKTVIGCQDCHTPADDQGKPLPGMDFGGGGLFHDPSQGTVVFSKNITPDPSGIAHYDEALFTQTLRTGRTAGGLLSHIMPFENLKNLTDDDLHDIYSYLKTLRPVQHRVSNSDPPAKCVLCGQTHGLGDLNAKK
jgi:mono/diheme cytochrome c family protein